jgi:hypothetical protein
MADTSRLMDVVSQLEPKIDELIAYKSNNPPGGGGGSDDGGQAQAQIDAATDRLQQFLARIP